MQPSQNKTSISIFISLLLWCYLLVWIVYGKAISLPFYFDDLIILPYLSENSFVHLLTTPAIFPYYRPVLPLIWKFLYELFGTHQAELLHTINLFLHGLNAFLAAVFAHLLLRKNGYPKQIQTVCMFFVASIYLIFPFHFQAVPWITAVYHILVTTFILATLITYWQYQAQKKKRWLILGLISSFLALFTQENGVLILPLLFFLELTISLNWREIKRWHQFMLWLLPYFLWFPIWISRPQTTSELGLNQLETVFQNLVWLFQGATFPLSWAGGQIREAGYNDMVVTLFLGILALILISLVYVQNHRVNKQGHHFGATLIYPSVFIIISALPILFILPFAYLLSSPRLLTLPAIGISWIWGITISTLILIITNGWHNAKAKTAVNIILLIFSIILIFVPAQRFLNRQMRFHEMLGNNIHQLVDLTTKANERGETAVALNFPYELGVYQTQFPLGHEGIVFIAGYIPEANIVSVQSENATDIAFIRVDDIRSQTPYIHGVMGSNTTYQALSNLSSQLQIINTVYLTDSIEAKIIGQQMPPVDGEDQANFLLENLAAIHLRESSYQQIDNNLQIDFSWEVDTPIPPEMTMFVHVTDATGQLIAQADGFAWGGSYPLSQWPLDKTVQDRRLLKLNEDVQHPIHVYVGFYNTINGERLPAIDKTGNTVSNNAVEVFAE